MSVKWYGNQVLATAEKAMEQGLDILANKIVKHAQNAMKEPKSGKMYPKAQTRSSAPYEAPAAQHGSGGLQGRIHTKNAGKLARLAKLKKLSAGLFS